MRESEVCRAIGNGKRGCRQEIHPIGDRRDYRAWQDDLFRMPSSAPRERQHAIAGANVVNASRAFEHDTGDLQAGNEGQLGFDLIFFLDHQDVGKVDAGSAHPRCEPVRRQGMGSPRPPISRLPMLPSERQRSARITTLHGVVGKTT